MSPRSSLLFVLATAAGLLTVHACILLGGAPRVAAVAFCAFALLIAAPIAILAWIGSLSGWGETSRQRDRQLKREKQEALLWQRTLSELQAPLWSEHPRVYSGSGPDGFDQTGLARAASAPARPGRPVRTANRRILAHCIAVASTFGLMGCSAWNYVWGPPAEWGMVRPGIGTAELVSLVGAPTQIKSNGTAEVWHYCRDFFGRDARYYFAVLVDREQVQEVRPYNALSRAGCEEYYRAEF
jgi:hypothetical protein